jgi:hypothetical protein
VASAEREAEARATEDGEQENCVEKAAIGERHPVADLSWWL